MPCRQVSTYNGLTGSGQSGGGGYTTEADCLNACREGACCEGTSCSVKPQCQCQGTGQTFKGVGTTCAGNSCGCEGLQTGACCGPEDIYTPYGTGPYKKCRGRMTASQCAAIGGTFAGVCSGCNADAALPSIAWCNPLP